jgi:hypothetical protein
MLCHKPENPASTTITLTRVLWSFSRHSLYGVCAGGPNQSCFWLWALVYSYVLGPSGNVYRYGRNMALELCSTRTASKKHFQYVARLPLTVLTILDAFMAREQPLLMHVINLCATAPVGYQPSKAAISHPSLHKMHNRGVCGSVQPRAHGSPTNTRGASIALEAKLKRCLGYSCHR